MSSFNGLSHLAEYPEDSKSFCESNIDESFQDNWKSKYYQLLEERETKDRQLKDTLDSLAAIVNRLEAEVQMLRTDRKQLSQRLESVVQENKALKENRSCDTSDLRSKLMLEREKFQEELFSLSGHLEQLQKELNVVKAKKAKQGEMQKKVESRQIELTHEHFMQQLEDKERRIRVRPRQSLEFQNKELMELIGGENSMRPISPSRPLTDRGQIKKRRTLSTSRKSMGRLHSPKSQRTTESAKKAKQTQDSLQSTSQLEAELDKIKRKLQVYANSPTRQKDRVHLRSLKKKYEEELVQKKKREVVKRSNC
jgi:hypothetical protein